MCNDQMKANRFLRWAEARQKLARIQKHLNQGGRVMLVTYTKATIYDKRHGVMFRATKEGLFVQRGKNFDCLNFTPIKFIA